MAQHVESAGCNLRTRQKQAESQRKVAPIWHRSASTCILVLSLAGVAQAEPCGPPLPAVQLVTPVRGYDARDAHLWSAAVAGAIVADQVTTERVLVLDGLTTPGYKPRPAWEQNRTPGMQSFGGRLAWSAAELGVITWGLHSEKPAIRKWAKVAAVASVLTRGYCAVHNIRERNKALDFDRAHR